MASLEVIERYPERVVVAIGIHELRIINNALNEVCNALPSASFETRIGASLVDARLVLDEVNALLPR